jgi:hypothetical protein
MVLSWSLTVAISHRLRSNNVFSRQGRHGNPIVDLGDRAGKRLYGVL